MIRLAVGGSVLALAILDLGYHFADPAWLFQTWWGTLALWLAGGEALIRIGRPAAGTIHRLFEYIPGFALGFDPGDAKRPPDASGNAVLFAMRRLDPNPGPRARSALRALDGAGAAILGLWLLWLASRWTWGSFEGSPTLHVGAMGYLAVRMAVAFAAEIRRSGVALSLVLLARYAGSACLAMLVLEMTGAVSIPYWRAGPLVAPISGAFPLGAILIVASLFAPVLIDRERPFLRLHRAMESAGEDFRTTRIEGDDLVEALLAPEDPRARFRRIAGSTALASFAAYGCAGGAGGYTDAMRMLPVLATFAYVRDFVAQLLPGARANLRLRWLALAPRTPPARGRVFALAWRGALVTAALPLSIAFGWWAIEVLERLNSDSTGVEPAISVPDVVAVGVLVACLDSVLARMRRSSNRDLLVERISGLLLARGEPVPPSPGWTAYRAARRRRRLAATTIAVLSLIPMIRPGTRAFHLLAGSAKGTIYPREEGNIHLSLRPGGLDAHSRYAIRAGLVSSIWADDACDRDAYRELLDELNHAYESPAASRNRIAEVHLPNLPGDLISRIPPGIREMWLLQVSNTPDLSGARRWIDAEHIRLHASRDLDVSPLADLPRLSILDLDAPVDPTVLLTGGRVPRLSLTNSRGPATWSVHDVPRLRSLEVESGGCEKFWIAGTPLHDLSLIDCKRLEELLVEELPDLRWVAIQANEALRTIRIRNCRQLQVVRLIGLPALERVELEGSPDLNHFQASSCNPDADFSKLGVGAPYLQVHFDPIPAVTPSWWEPTPTPLPSQAWDPRMR